VDESRVRPQCANGADLRRIARALEEQRAALAKCRQLADIVAKRPLPVDDLPGPLEQQAPTVGLRKAAREIHRVVVGERMHVGARDLVLGRRVPPHRHAVDQPVLRQVLLDEGAEHPSEPERLPRHARDDRRHGRELA
jgi:hypothetical protein